jgi:hypothetical protein
MIISRNVEYMPFDKNGTIKACQEILNEKPSHVFLTAFWENWHPSETLQWADNFFKHNNIPVTWIINHWSKPDIGWKKFNNPIVFVDFVLWRVYKEVVIKKKNAVNTIWNPDADQYLFLTGKPDKFQRIGLFYKLYKNDLLENCNYSLFMNPGMIAKSKKYVPELSNEEFESFVLQHQRNPDNICYIEQIDSLHYGGIPYDPALYSTSLFRLISETNMHLRTPWPTEKTWLTILNRNPFVIAGDLGTCEYLQSRGIETFDKLFDIPTYDNISSWHGRLDHVVAHVKQWMDRNFDKDRVADMVEKNYNRLVELALQEKAHVENSTGYDIDVLVDTCDFLAGESN